ncbi:MAG: DUF5615 family PIN-like protein [candidate division NC10 bacterium]|nr:DUF5615 family PIN-like protein [candidate division NC10 bacterium]
MKYYLDEDLSPDIAVAGRARGLDVVSAHEREARAIPDEEQLSRAAAEGRCLVTFNRNDFLRVTRQAYDRLRPHCGILIVPPSFRYEQYGTLADALVAHASKFPDGLPPYTIAFLGA